MSLTLLSLTTALAAATPQAALLSLEVKGELPSEVAPGALIEASILEQAGLELVTGKKRDELVASAKDLGIVCDLAEPGCASRVGAYSRLDFVLVAKVSASPPSAVITLIDTASGEALREAGGPLGESVAELRAGLQALTTEALTGEVARGVLVVQAPEGARVSVDGSQRGAAPLTLELKRGVHAVEVVDLSGARAEASAEVRAGVQQTLVLTPGSSGPGAGGGDDGDTPWLTWSGLGLMSVGLVAAGGLGVGTLLIAPSREDRPNLTADEYNARIATGRALLVGTGVAGAVAVIGGVLTGVGLAVE